MTMSSLNGHYLMAHSRIAAELTRRLASDSRKRCFKRLRVVTYHYAYNSCLSCMVIMSCTYSSFVLTCLPRDGTYLTSHMHNIVLQARATKIRPCHRVSQVFAASHECFHPSLLLFLSFTLLLARLAISKSPCLHDYVLQYSQSLSFILSLYLVELLSAPGHVKTISSSILSSYLNDALFPGCPPLSIYPLHCNSCCRPGL